MPRKQQQIAADHDGAHQFTDEAEHRHPRQQASPAQVEHGGHGDEHERNDGGRDGGAVDAEQLRKKRRHAGGHAGHGAAQGPGVHPAGHPCPALANEASRPGIQAARDRKLRDDLAEYQAHHELAQADQDVGPPHRRAAGDESAGEDGVHADHRREVGKSQGEVFPLRHGPIEVRHIPQCFQLLGVLIDAHGGIVSHPRSPSILTISVGHAGAPRAAIISRKSGGPCPPNIRHQQPSAVA